MRFTPSFALSEREELARIIRANPWATLVSAPGSGLVASHYPVLLEEGRDDLSVVTHVGRPDEVNHELGEHELLMIFQGPHGYISPGWYGDGPNVPTWNFSVVHLRGIPEILSAEENLAVLEKLVEHFESPMPEPRLMRGTLANSQYADRISKGTVGLRLVPTHIDAKNKLSQNKSADVVATIIDNLENGANYAHPELAAEMRRAHGLPTRLDTAE